MTSAVAEGSDQETNGLKIAYIAAGAGGMYCGSCIRDNSLARTLMGMGHNVLLQPIYTPLRTDEESVAAPTVRYGAVNLYLQQKNSLFGRLPGFLRRWLDNPKLLRRLTANPEATDARELGELTLSMLRGEEGQQAVELEGLVRYLKDEFEPDVIQLTNSMLLGLARRLKQELPNTRVVTALQGEDIFLADLEPPYRERVEQELRNRARHSDMFLATSEFYADSMTEFLGLDPERVMVSRLGLSFDGYVESPDDRVRHSPEGLNIGFLARVCPEKGLHNLVEAFETLVARRPGEVFLHVAGYEGGRDHDYLAGLKQRLESHTAAGAVRFWGEVDRATKQQFLHGLDVLSVPTEYHEPKGLSILEAMAAGVPVVQPAHGAFPEMLEKTGGGWLVQPGSAEALAAQLERVLDDSDALREKGGLAHNGVRQSYTQEQMAQETVEAYRRALSMPTTSVA